MMEIVAKNIFRLRADRGMTQQELAENTGFTRAKIAGWENNKSDPNYNDLLKIADYFGVSSDEILRQREFKIISNNIAFLRSRNKLSQEAFAALMGFSRSRISAWEEHRCEPSVNALIWLSNYFNYPIDTLLKIDLKKCIKSL